MEKKKLYLILCLALAVLGVVFFLTDTSETETTVSLIEKHTSGAGRLSEEAAASQTFTVGENGLKAVSVMVSTYNKKITEGTLTLSLYQGETLVARQEYPAAELNNNAFLSLELKEKQASAGKSYTLTVQADCEQQKGLTVRLGDTEKQAGMKLTLPDGTETEEQALNVRYTCGKTVYGVMDLMTCLLIALCFGAALPLFPGKEKANVR